MKKLMLVIFIALLFTTASLTPVSAKKNKVVEEPSRVLLYEETVLVDYNTTKLEIGFVTVTFVKNFVDKDLYPLTFDVQLYAEDGLVYIQFDPSMDYFIKAVKIHVSSYEGFMYDYGTDEYIYVDIPTQTFKVDHFSRYCIAW